MLCIDNITYVDSREAASVLGLKVQTFRNYVSMNGDDFLKAHRDILTGRVFYDLKDVRARAAEREAR